jgi:SulP family sulfate permease
MTLSRYIPLLGWAKTYSLSTLSNDMVAALIVTIMLIPQSLAYALLAGVPAQVGLYASIAPLLVYAVFGTSRALSVGPVAVVSLMTAAAIGTLGLQSVADVIAAASVLALISGLFLLLMGVLRLGFLANFLSHPVVSGFITASGIIIAASQTKHLLGIDAHGHSLLDLALSLGSNLGETHAPTLAVGGSALVFLFWVRKGLKGLLLRLGLPPLLADMLAKAGPVFAVAGTTLAVWGLDLSAQGVAVIGDVPKGLPGLTVPLFDVELWRALAVPAVLISVIGFVESVSVGQTLAAKRRQRIDPDQELIALGGANLSSSAFGGFPVTGGFSRSVVNYDAGAQTPAAGAYTAIGIALATLFLTPLLFFLPKATLAATIIVAVLSLVDFSMFTKTWRYSKADFAAVLTTVVLTLALGVEVGVTAGVVLSLVLYLYKTARPHVAEVGLVEGTEHFRNVLRYTVKTRPDVVTLRVDQSLYFANARALEDLVLKHVARAPEVQHIVLMCSAINEIDTSALESLEAINQRLSDSGVLFHLSEVKGPVMDRLQRSDFLERLSGDVFLSQFDAFNRIGPAAAADQQPA